MSLAFLPVTNVSELTKRAVVELDRVSDEWINSLLVERVRPRSRARRTRTFWVLLNLSTRVRKTAACFGKVVVTREVFLAGFLPPSGTKKRHENFTKFCFHRYDLLVYFFC